MKPSEAMLLTAMLLAGAVLLGLTAAILFHAAQPAWGLCLGLAGFLAGLAFAAFWRSDQVLPSALLGYMFGTLITAAAGLAITADIGTGRTIALLALGAASLAASLAAIQRIGEGSEIRLESEWGGLGQGLGGWRLSSPAALLLAALVLGGLVAGVATSARPPQATASPTDAAPPAVPGEKAKAAAKTEK